MATFFQRLAKAAPIAFNSSFRGQSKSSFRIPFGAVAAVSGGISYLGYYSSQDLVISPGILRRAQLGPDGFERLKKWVYLDEIKEQTGPKARALLEWHSISQFCGHCGEKTVPKEAGRRKQCSSGLCRKRVYPRVDPVVIMLVIDRENNRALLSRQSRFVPRMWSCLAGFIEVTLGNMSDTGESLEEAVRRETWEETGIEVGEVVYHSSQPWPGMNVANMPGQLMFGFFAYAKSLEINVDKDELEGTQEISL
ncbi:hypothetical protein FF1_026161 [Malus domestica]